MPIKLQSSSGGSVTLDVPVTASNFNVTVPNASGTAMVSGNMPAFRAYNNATQLMTVNTWTKVAYQVKDFDTANCYDNTTNYRFTPNVAGYYQVSASVFLDWGGSAGAALRVSVYKNGSSHSYTGIAFGSNTGPYDAMGLSDLIYLNGSTDYIEVYAYNNNTSPQIDGSTGGSRFAAVLVRGA